MTLKGRIDGGHRFEVNEAERDRIEAENALNGFFGSLVAAFPPKAHEPADGERIQYRVPGSDTWQPNDDGRVYFFDGYHKGRPVVCALYDERGFIVPTGTVFRPDTRELS